jgi:hypothetical protein
MYCLADIKAEPGTCTALPSRARTCPLFRFDRHKRPGDAVPPVARACDWNPCHIIAITTTTTTTTTTR